MIIDKPSTQTVLSYNIALKLVVPRLLQLCSMKLPNLKMNHKPTNPLAKNFDQLGQDELLKTNSLYKYAIKKRNPFTH